MALFKHKDSIPELPMAPSFPSSTKIPSRNNINELPTLPVPNSQKDNFGEEMVKSAISDLSAAEENEVNCREIVKDPLHVNQEVNNSHVVQQNVPIAPVAPEKKTIFVKVDKYHALQDALGEIQEQIKNLSKQVQTLKEVKTRQVREINVWDEEMKKINQRLSKIDSGIFGEV